MCIAVHCSALQCNFAFFAFFVLFFYFFCMIWFHTIILMPNKYKNHLFIAKTNELILAPFISIHTTPPHICKAPYIYESYILYSSIFVSSVHFQLRYCTTSTCFLHTALCGSALQAEPSHNLHRPQIDVHR